jgi:hypothetical protein
VTPEQFAAAMKALDESLSGDDGDEAACHVSADSMMLEILEKSGYGEGVEIFRNMPKWYE